MKKWMIRLMLMAAIGMLGIGILAGCSATQKTSADQQKSVQNLYVTVEPGAKLGPDGKLHDAFINGDIKVTEGQPVTIHFYNFDEMTHTYTSDELGMDVKIKASVKEGQAAETLYTFTPKKAGTYSWYCADPCDQEAGQWAMAHDGYMKGNITVLPATNKTQYVSLVINADYVLGEDGELHDAFIPGNITLLKGQPVELTIYNFDDAKHSYTSEELGFDFDAPGSTKEGEATVNTFKFTPEKAGTFNWLCDEPCDPWAMAHDGYMMGSIVVQ